jgi:Asp-tRNA(Asn)/Glu-tRNA(Gln) amidotransferase A subunit family amidase
MARTVADLRTLFTVVAGPDAGDALSAPVPLREIAAAKLKGLRIGVLESPALGRATPDTISAVRAAVQSLAALEYRVEPISLQKLDRAIELWWFFFGPVIGKLIRESARGKEELFSPMLRELLEVVAGEPAVTLESFIANCTERDTLRGDLLRQMRDVPILLSPVSTAPAFRHGAGNFRAGDPYNYRDTMRFCQWLNLVGFPGISLPFGRSPEGLPINLQLIGRPYEEELLLAVAESLEQARGPWQAPPI